ncbi:MAG: hypothetical protein LUG16_00370 [Candidatus Gastranaerophilales bacterium]|nr:hypothetical protein [Candidatus Gastranaerophilales bacterium]
MRGGGSHTIKSIINPREVIALINPHAFKYKKDKLAVTENFEKIHSHDFASTKYISVNKIRINHYHCKSLEEYQNKCNQGYADQTKKREFSPKAVNFEKTTQDYVIQKYLPELKKRLTGIQEEGC